MRTALIAIAFAFVAASPAGATTIVNDPDEPAVANDLDIEWVSASDRFVTGTGWQYTVTVKTRAPYAARPCVFLRVNGTVNYRLCRAFLQSGGAKWPITMTENALAGVVSYTFEPAQIGGATAYELVARTVVFPVTDFAPDAGRAVFQRNALSTSTHVINTRLLETPWTQVDPRMDRPGLDDLPECITC